MNINTSDYSKCSLCGDWAVGGITVELTRGDTTPSGRSWKPVSRKLCPQCTETVGLAAVKWVEETA